MSNEHSETNIETVVRPAHLFFALFYWAILVVGAPDPLKHVNLDLVFNAVRVGPNPYDTKDQIKIDVFGSGAPTTKIANKMVKNKRTGLS